MPKTWDRVYAKLEAGEYDDVKLAAIDLALVFGDSRAVDSLRAMVMNKEKWEVYGCGRLDL